MATTAAHITNANIDLFHSIKVMYTNGMYKSDFLSGDSRCCAYERAVKRIHLKQRTCL